VAATQQYARRAEPRRPSAYDSHLLAGRRLLRVGPTPKQELHKALKDRPYKLWKTYYQLKLLHLSKLTNLFRKPSPQGGAYKIQAYPNRVVYGEISRVQHKVEDGEVPDVYAVDG